MPKSKCQNGFFICLESDDLRVEVSRYPFRVISLAAAYPPVGGEDEWLKFLPDINFLSILGASGHLVHHEKRKSDRTS